MHVIIIGDHNTTKMCRILETQGVEYDLADTLDEACEKVFSQSYDGIVLDIHFPKSKGMEPTPSGKVFLDWLEEKRLEIPVLVNSTIINPPKSNCIVGRMFPWEYHEFEKFLNEIKNKD